MGKMDAGRNLFSLLLTLACYSIAAGVESRVKRDSAWTVTTMLDEPYTKKIGESQAKNEDFEGYVPDLLKKIGDHLKQTYTIKVVGDGKYGAKDSTGHWTGMIGELVDGKAQVAAAAITVTDARREVVDFTHPLMKIKPVVVMKKPADGTESKIKTVQDLAGQTEIKYFAVKDGTTLHLIRNSTDANYIKIGNVLVADQSLSVTRADEGIRKVREGDGKYAFFTESATANYWMNRDKCDLFIIDTDLQTMDYAFAVKKGSEIMAKLNSAIAHLEKNGELTKTYNDWWKNMCSAAVRNVWGSVPVAVVVLSLRLLV